MGRRVKRIFSILIICMKYYPIHAGLGFPFSRAVRLIEEQLGFYDSDSSSVH